MTPPKPLIGRERDEIVEMVSRIKAGADRAAQSHFGGKAPVSSEDLDWATSQQLPSEFFQFFELDRS